MIIILAITYNKLCFGMFYPSSIFEEKFILFGEGHCRISRGNQALYLKNEKNPVRRLLDSIIADTHYIW